MLIARSIGRAYPVGLNFDLALNIRPQMSKQIPGGQFMAAYAKENRIELITDRHDFKRRTGMILDFREIQWLGLTLDNMLGMFCEERVSLLLNFIEKNKDYHVITSDSKYRWTNRFIPGHQVYYLAEGDKNPYLVLHSNLETEREQMVRRLRMMRLRELAMRSGFSE